jgi:TolA-binding protein
MTPPVFSTLFVCLAAAIVSGSWVIARHLGGSKQAKAALTTSKEYRALSDEYRRLTDMAITSQEHTELRLTELSVQIGQLNGKLEEMQRILKEVE